MLGENFSAHSVTNPDQDSERKLISQLAPELSEELVTKLVAAFHDLRKGYENGTLSYPYSLRGASPYFKLCHPALTVTLCLELINLVRHLKAYPNDSLGEALRNIFDFDVYKPETTDHLAKILLQHG